MSAVTRYFRPEEHIFIEGDSSRALYLIKKGTVSIRKTKGSSQLEISKVYAGEVLGELSFFDKKNRSAAAVALTEVEVLEIDYVSLEKIYSVVPGYFKTIITAMVERLRKANETIRRLKSISEEDHSDDAPLTESSAKFKKNEPKKADPKASDVLETALSLKMPLSTSKKSKT